jgi:hypothetical protein
MKLQYESIIYLNNVEVELAVTARHINAERATWYDPPVDEDIEIEEVLLNGVDVATELDGCVMNEIKDKGFCLVRGMYGR